VKVELLWPGRRRRWHALLADRLAARGHALVLSRGREGAPVPAGTGMLLAVERRIYKAGAPLFEVAAVPDAPQQGGGDALDRSCAKPQGPAADLVIELLFHGACGDGGLVAALLKGRAPAIVVRRLSGSGWTDLAHAMPAVEEPDVLARALEAVLGRLVEIVDRAVRAAETGAPCLGGSDPAPAPARSVAGFFARGLARKLARRLGPARGRPEHWRIAYRKLDNAAPIQLPEDGLRFQADPFAVAHGDRSYIFYEDYPYAGAKGVIARVEVEADGGTTPPRAVLEQPFHLSYPFILERGGTFYMLPETSAARRIQLFRADPFPDRWLGDHVLVDDVVASDATPILHEGRWWIFATLSEDGGSTWDRLGLFHAPDLFGPWTAHPANPVLVDAGAARPAGAMWHESGRLMRVAQDCRAGYGCGLAICRVDRLDLKGYAQRIVERRAPPSGSGATGLHTLNRTAALEVFDLKLPHRRSDGRAVLPAPARD
jgi:hypothetical protein